MAIPAPRPGAVALVTGASSGIGAELARQLAGRGHDLVVVARRQDRLASLAAELPGRQVHQLAADVSDAAERAALMQRVEDLGVQVDVAVLSAGFGMGGPFVDHDPDRIVQMVRTNLESTMLLTHAVLPGMMRRRRGAILIVSSMAGHSPMPGFGAYEAGRAGVTVTALAPGGVRTEFAEAANMVAQERSAPGALMMDADACARVALAGLEAGRRVVMPRILVRGLARFGRHAPRRVWLPVCRHFMVP